MNVRQALLEIRRLMRAMQWHDGSTYVFGGTDDTDGDFYIGSKAAELAIEKQQSNAESVVGHVWAGTARHDADSPELTTQRIHMRICAIQSEDAADDPQQERPHAGGFRTGAEPGGILHAFSQLLSDYNYLGPDSGWIKLVAVDRSEVRRMPKGASLQMTWEATCTIDPVYPPCSRLIATGGVGQISLTWTRPPTRWDRIDIAGGQVVRYASGATPPSSATDGIGGGTVGTAETTHTITGLATGTYSVALFQGYERDFPAPEIGSVVDVYSSAVTAVSVIVT